EKPESYACKSKRASGVKSGIDLWNKMQDFRANICKTIVESSSNDSVKYKFMDPKINKYEDQETLKAELAKLFKSGKWKFHQSDSAVVSDTYIALTKNEMVPNEHEEGTMEHWIGKTFNHAPAVGALASLSSIQKEILTARADAISVIRLRIGGGDYSFNSIRALATPKFAVVNPGDEIEIEVSMAAYDSDKQPDVKPNQGTLKGKPVDGIGTVTARATSGKMEFTGTVAITNKFGKQRIESYKTEVQVATKSGSLEMPEFNILYRGYGNKIIPSASGVLSTSISAPGCTVTPITHNGKKGFAVKPGAGTRTVAISLSGKDAKGKSVSFGSTSYTVKSFPKPAVTTKSISKGGGRIQVALENSPINANFKIKSITVGDDFSGSGDVIPASALAKTKVGKSVTVVITAVNLLTNESVDLTGALKVTN
ncbi:MAG: hypothetical protein ACOVNZ_03715, partial [Crocinitomicaceae bacterium]